MSKKKKNKKHQSKTNRIPKTDTNTSWIAWLPILLSIVCIPLIVRAVSYYSILSEYIWNGTGSSYLNDVFLIAKGWAIYLTAGLSLFFLLCMVLLGKDIRIRSRWLLFPAGYLLLAFISSILSKYRRIAFLGSQDLHQPCPILTGYFVLFYYTCFLVTKEEGKSDENRMKTERIFLRCFLTLAIILSLTGLLQLSGNDPFQCKIVQRFCGLNNVQILNSGRIYTTLYHPDYVGMMVAMLIPIIGVGILLEDSPVRFFYEATEISLVICLFASKTRSGIFAFLVTGLLGLILLLMDQSREKKRAIFLIPFGALILLVAGVIFMDNPVSERLFQFTEEYEYHSDGVSGIETGKENCKLIIGHKKMKLSWADTSRLEISEQNGESIVLQEASESERQNIRRKLKRMQVKADISKSLIYRSNQLVGCYFIQIDQKNTAGQTMESYAVFDGEDIWLIAKRPDKEGYVMMNREGAYTESVISEDAFSSKMYGIASYRGYIWSKTVAKLGNTVLIGEGPDTFPLFFPNQDYVARHLIGEDGTIINKPHNWYLQMAAETGCLSVILVIVYLLYYLCRSCYLITREATPGKGTMNEMQRRRYKTLLAGVGLAVLSYMIAALANDSMVVCAPVFWILLGYGSGLINE